MLFQKKFLFILSCIMLCSTLQAQQKQAISLEEIFLQNKFQQNTVRGINWMKDGEFYTSLVNNAEGKADFILKYNIKSGEVVDTLVDASQLVPEGQDTALPISEYALSANENKILLAT